MSICSSIYLTIFEYTKPLVHVVAELALTVELKFEVPPTTLSVSLVVSLPALPFFVLKNICCAVSVGK